MQKNKVRFIGLGRTGFSRTSNLAKAGTPLTLFVALREPVDALVAIGASAGQSATCDSMSASSAPRSAILSATRRALCANIE
ncbi:MAG: hypothetical protein BMS9Abin01_1983 [Gammaproteobacteria bacterium]|nr:MAG: hypothetical protein BMS9Abin01_1983 [Gammaproteobacteria bacterium]